MGGLQGPFGCYLNLLDAGSYLSTIETASRLAQIENNFCLINFLSSPESLRRSEYHKLVQLYAIAVIYVEELLFCQLHSNIYIICMR